MRMKEINTIKNGYKIFSHRFESSEELVNWITSRTNRAYMDRYYLNDDYIPSGSEYPEWSNFSNGKQLKHDFLTSNIKENIDVIKSAFKGAGEHVRQQRYSSPVGFTPIVANAIQGLPNSMINSKRVKMKSKIITIYIDTGVRCGIDPYQVLDAGKDLVSEIIALEKKGYRVNIYALGSFNTNYDSSIVSYKVKDAGQPIDIQRIMYPLLNVAFFRGICFGWYAINDKITHCYSYGHALAFCSNYQKETVYNTLFSDGIYWGVQQQIEDTNYLSNKQKEIENKYM